MLAYHVEHHMRARLAPMLSDETDHEQAAAMRTSIVAKAEALKLHGASGQPASPKTACRCTICKTCSPISQIQAPTALNENYVFTLHNRPAARLRTPRR
jgi:hypothetical protein